MNKKIWMTGALSIAAIFITVFIYNNFIMDRNASAEKQSPPERTEAEVVEQYQQTTADFISLTEKSGKTLNYKNDLFTVVFSADGGVPVSIKLNAFNAEDGGNVEMIFSGSSGLFPFSIHNGGYESAVISGNFNGSQSGDEVVFSGLFSDNEGNIFEITKSYLFIPGSYLFRFNVDISAVEGALPLGDGEYIYSLGMGPQLGPEIEALVRTYVYRYFCLVDEDEKRNLGTPAEIRKLTLDTPYKWLGVEGRYFAGITIPGFSGYSPAWDERDAEGIFKRNQYYIQRKTAETGLSDRVADSYYIYFGPKDKKILEANEQILLNNPDLYSSAPDGVNLTAAAAQSGVINALSVVVKAALDLIHRLIPNYGLAIIIFALIIQAAIFPVSRRTYDNAIRMQLLGPELAALKKKYKYNDAKMSEESLKLFQSNNVKPRSSLAPFVIHLPFFILTYVLLLTNIDFRLEAFIPGWISDIALPEYIINIAPIRIPVTGWDKIRLLPLIVLGLSLVQSRYIQAPEDSVKSMRIMSYLIPFVMFLVIYNMPAGAVLYWLTMTLTNLLFQWRIKTGYVNKK